MIIMATKAKQGQYSGAEQAYSNLRSKLDEKGYEVVKEEEYTLADGSKVKTLLEIPTPSAEAQWVAYFSRE